MRKSTLQKLAVFSPVNPVRSGISDYMEALFPYLTERFDIDFFLDGYNPESPAINKAGIFHRRDFEWKNRLQPYSVILYQLGNNKTHQYLYPNLFRYPGVVILHEVNLHQARAYEHLSKGKLGDYLAETAYCHGSAGLKAAKIIAHGYHSRLLYDRFPMLNLVCDSATTVIVHSRYARSALLSLEHPPKVDLVNAPLIDTTIPDPESARKRLNIKPGTFIVASFGFIAPGKELSTAVKSFERFVKTHPDSRYFLVGSDLESGYSDQLLSSVSLETARRIKVTGFISESCFRDYLAAADLCINLRYPTQGETSSALLRVMGAAKPVIVSRYRQFREIPSDSCFFVDLWPNLEESVFRALTALADHPEIRRETGKNGRKYVLRHHDKDTWGEKITDILSREAKHSSRVTPLSYKSPLPHVSITPLEEQLAAPLANWAPGKDKQIIRQVSITAENLNLKFKGSAA